MTNISTTSPTLQSEAETTVYLLDNWFDAIEVGLRERVREFIQAMIESELEVALARPRYGRRPTADIENGDVPNGIVGHRHGHRSRSLKPAAGSTPLAYSSPEAVQTTGTVAPLRLQLPQTGAKAAATSALVSEILPSEPGVASFGRPSERTPARTHAAEIPVLPKSSPFTTNSVGSCRYRIPRR